MTFPTATHRPRTLVAGLLATAGLGLTALAAPAQADPAASFLEQLDIPAQAVPPAAGDAHRFTYTTTGAQDAPTTSSAAVYLPTGPAPEGGWPVLAWAHGTVGLNDVCAYSTNGPGAVDRDWAYLGHWLDQGYAIVATDYAGLGTPGDHPYLNGKVEAHNVVDAVKVASGTYPELGDRWGVVGQSQGGGAAMITARYANEFGGSADALSYRGAVATGVPAYIEELLPLVMRPLQDPAFPVEYRNPSPTLTTYLLYIVSGLRTSHPEWDVDSYLTDYGHDWVGTAEGPVCDGDGGITDLIRDGNVQVGKLFSRPLEDIPGFRDALRDYMGVPESGYDAPVFMGQGALDTDVGPGAIALAGHLKANGEPVEFHLYPDQDHSGTVNTSLADSDPFVARIFG
jgi:acetyl esterase/lipase